ncbi:MAG TPA: LacI family transcriptional regulator [Candidatus Olsenella avicola]|uniref:LacI family DNA-binding transcriptional regulator n=1 Tax=Olsenella sp. An285 TaxID=1965621 RepID=UPI000B3A4B80|nr:LacI family DNA-binding transcriptional regulator [Olsenella sp. An285]OUO47077.1 LacI family transcriptional regulator [Olsenella sp. An285]HIY52003.1 LacI family transcriptional regulator [Candidatus Olsenella avicola]
MATKVTLRQIADEVGVSTTAVSNVLNNKPCRVSTEVREQIKSTARRMHYIPNQIARSLVKRRSNSLGLIVPDLEVAYFASIAKHFEVLCRELGYSLLITNSSNNAGNDPKLVDVLLNQGVDGIFLVTSDDLVRNHELIDKIKSLPVPLVLVDRTLAGIACDEVLYDSEVGGYLATKHLIDSGHRKIACIVNSVHSRSGQLRLAGYRRALDEAGIEFNRDYVIESDYEIETAYRAAGQLRDSDATAVFASSDAIAVGLLRRMYDSGHQVPRDRSVVSYDNSVANLLFNPKLTAVEQDVGQLTERSLDLLVKRLNESDAEAEARVPESVILRPGFHYGKSVRVIS